MSKVDAMRALREARQASTVRSPAASPVASPAAGPVASPAASPKSRAKAAASPAKSVEGEPARCGHRSISNKSCTREAGHSEKNHRYG